MRTITIIIFSPKQAVAVNLVWLEHDELIADITIQVIKKFTQDIMMITLLPLDETCH